LFRRQNSGITDSDTFYVLGRLPSGGTATIDILDIHNSDAVVPLDSNTCSQVGNGTQQSGIWKFDLSNVTTFPTAGERQWYYTMEHSTGVKDDGVVDVGGYQDNIDYSLVALSGDFVVVSGMVHRSSGNVVVINTNVDTTVSSRLASASYTAPDNTRIEFISGVTHQDSGNMFVVSGNISDEISPKAIETNVAGHVTTALNSYDPPTMTELTTVSGNLADDINLRLLSSAYTAPDHTRITTISGMVHRESGQIFANLDAVISTVSGNLASQIGTPAVSGDVANILQFMSGDYVLNTGTTPWREEIYQSGTSTLLFYRELYTVTGGNVVASGDVIGRRSGS